MAEETVAHLTRRVRNFKTTQEEQDIETQVPQVPATQETTRGKAASKMTLTQQRAEVISQCPK